MFKNQVRNVCFTWNMQGGFLPTAAQVKERLAGVDRWAFQLERAPTTGTLHWQGWAANDGAKQMSRWMKLLMIDGKGASVTKQIARMDKHAYNYCLKEETRVKPCDEYTAAEIGPHHFGFTPQKEMAKIIDPLEGKKLKPFQEELLLLYEQPADDRTVCVFVDKKGGNGKTALAKHLALKGETIIVGGSAKDLLYAVSMWVDGDKEARVEPKPLKAAIWNVTRSQQDYMSWQGIEALKDGLFCNTKYKSKMVTMNPIHVWIFMNDMPDMTKLSSDRWAIFNVENGDMTKIEQAFPIFNPATRVKGKEELTYAKGGKPKDEDRMEG